MILARLGGMDVTAHLPAAALWDMDGTIIDSEPLWLRTELAMLERYDITMPAGTEHQLVGSGLRAAARLFQDLGVPLSSDEIISEWTWGVIAGLHADGPVWRPGARELLSNLSAAGVPCALVTMAVREIADAVVALLPASTFRVIVAGDEVSAEKPDPAPYLQAAAALGVDPLDCIAFEDSRTGLTSASSAGVVSIGIPHLVSLVEGPAHELWPTLQGYTVEHVSETFRTHRGRRRSPHAQGECA